MSSFRGCVVVFALFVLLALVLSMRLMKTTLLVFLVVLLARSKGFVLAAVSDNAFLPTAERLAVVAERSEVGVQNAAKILEGVSTLFEGVCVFVAVQAVTSVSLKAVARADEESRPLQRGGSSVWMGMQTA